LSTLQIAILYQEDIISVFSLPKQKIAQNGRLHFSLKLVEKRPVRHPHRSRINQPRLFQNGYGKAVSIGRQPLCINGQKEQKIISIFDTSAF